MPLNLLFPLPYQLELPLLMQHNHPHLSQLILHLNPHPPASSISTVHSSRITEPKSQGASQAVLHGVGLSEDDLAKLQIGISSVWYEGNTCNMQLLSLSEAVKEGVSEAGMVGFGFNTIGVSDAISMGTRRMCYSLQSRDLIADSIETVTSAQWYDGNISIPGCEKNMPGTIIAMGRLNRPSIMIYGGTTKVEYLASSDDSGIINQFCEENKLSLCSTKRVVISVRECDKNFTLPYKNKK